MKHTIKNKLFGVLYLLAAMTLGLSSAGAYESSAKFYITPDDAAEVIAQALVAEQAGDQITAEITSTRQRVLYTAPKPLDVEVKGLKFDLADSTFSTNLFFVDGEDVISAIPVSGRFEELVAVPVLSKRIRHGQEIAVEDIQMKSFPASKLRDNTLLDANKLVGRTPRRVVSKYRPIREDEIQQPDIVEKGKMVHMQYNAGGVNITTLGEALDDGTEGDSIRVRNHDSKMVVKALITSPTEVQVGNTPRHIEVSSK